VGAEPTGDRADVAGRELDQEVALGTPARDVAVVNTMGGSHLDWEHMLVVRGPAAFPH
jgi:hypothetical protein